MMDPDNSGSDRSVADILVLGGIVVTMDQRRNILSDGALAIYGDSIAALPGDRRCLPCRDYSRCHRVFGDPCSDRRAHTHIPMTLFHGLAADLPLHTWLEQ